MGDAAGGFQHQPTRRHLHRHFHRRRTHVVEQRHIGRVVAGRIRKGQNVAILKHDGPRVDDTVAQLYVFDRLGRVEAEEVAAGEEDEAAVIAEVDLGEEEPVAGEEEDTFLEEEEEEGADVTGYLDTGPAPKEGEEEA